MILTTWIGAAHRWAIAAERAIRGCSRAPDGVPAVHWHEGGAGPAVLLLNGFTASGLLWPTRLVELLEQSHTVIRVDNRGSGSSRTAPAPFTIATMADDAYDVLRATGHESAVVVGLSMGGMIAQELAIRHPEAVDRLVLVSTIPPPPANTPPGALVVLGSLVGSAAVTGEVPGQVLRRPVAARGTISQARAIIAWHGPDRLRQVVAPTTVICGLDDRVVPPANGRAIAGLVAGSTLVELPATGHLVPWEAAAEIVEAVGAGGAGGSVGG